MDATEIDHLRRKHRAFFHSGKTLPLEFRLQQIAKLCEAVKSRETAILAALRKDLNKPVVEAYGGELGVFFEELKLIRKKLSSWMRPKRVPTPVAHFLASSHLYPEPLGTVLIIAPWNYPFQLVISPLLGAIAAGNTVVLKPSELAPATSAVIEELVKSTFDPDYVACVQGGVEVTTNLLSAPWDHVFFTGSPAVGKIVMQAAAKHLTPVTLELGGKSPCLIDTGVPIKLTARRIAWGKFFNAGQTCIAPDYVLVPKNMREELLASLKEVLVEFYGEDPEKSADYGRIINERHFSRLTKLMEGASVYCGGQTNPEQRYLAPTILSPVEWSDPVMQDEIFGPILPVLEYEDLEEAISQIQAHPKPLSLYFFSKDTAKQEAVLKRVSFGGGCINDTLMHLANPHLPFGGVGNSGMGRYHGKYSFEAFSHYKSVLNKSFLVDIPLRYQPYKGKDGLVKRLFSA
ncbi:MAG: aldehyde dehydrogenase [Bdellovibrionota bacterium]